MTSFYAWVASLANRGVLPGDFQYPFLVRGFLCVLLLTPILGGLSHLVVARRMAFFSAALGQAALTGVSVGLLVLVLLARDYNDLLLDSLSPPLAGVHGADSRFLEYFFAFLLALSIVVSLKIVGALLVEALVVVPAAAARNVSRSARGYLLWSIAVAFAAGSGGLIVSNRFLVPTGAAVVLGASLAFFVTLVAGALRTGRRQA